MKWSFQRKVVASRDGCTWPCLAPAQKIRHDAACLIEWSRSFATARDYQVYEPWVGLDTMLIGSPALLM
jgi:hypothetical protein